MPYHVDITRRAERDLAAIFGAIDAANSRTSARWNSGLVQSLLTLEISPRQCPKTPEDPNLRHLLFGKKPHVCRVIYALDERLQIVTILHIRDGARAPVKTISARKDAGKS